MPTYIDGKTIPDLDKKTAAQISDKTKWSVEIGSEDSVIKESNGMLLSELETLIGGGGGGSKIEDTDGDTYVDTESGSDTDIVEIGSPATGTTLLAKFINGSAVEVLQVDGNGSLFNAGNFQLVNFTNDNLFIGTQSTHSSITTIYRNTFVGYKGGNAINAAADNVTLGYNAGQAIYNGVRNTLLGKSAGFAIYNGGYNVMIGYNAGVTQSANSYNTYIGYSCGSSNAGNSNIFLGTFAGSRQTTLANSLIIDNQQRTNAATELTDSLIVGEFNATKASQWLQVNGNLKTYGRQKNTETKTTLSINLTNINEVLFFDSSSNNVTMILPSITSSNHGKQYIFKVLDATNTCTISTDGSDTLDEAAATTETLALNDKRIYIADNNSSKWIRLN
jgi:hypothetical protein